MPDDYDMDAYIAKYGKPKPDARGHFTDEFKRPNHITFSDQSIYHSDDTPGGKWEEKEGKWHYTPSEFVLRQHGAEKLTNYFRDREPDAVLNLPVRKRLGGQPLK